MGQACPALRESEIIALSWSFVSNITNSKHQKINKSQIPSTKSQGDSHVSYFEFWSADFAVVAFWLRRLNWKLFDICNFNNSMGVYTVWDTR
jgi:hypothetical protein